MMKLYTFGTPNGRKISIALEEMGLDYEAVTIDITQGDQNTPEFLAINPNNKIPALVDDDGTIVNESGAILLYLAHKTGKFAPEIGSPGYWEMLEWLMWQMGGFGPMLGQSHHFLHFNPGVSAYAEERFATEARRLYSVLDQRLSTRDFITDELSVADFSIWPWVSRFEYQKIDLKDYPNVREWYQRLAQRPAFIKGYAVPKDVGPIPLG